jgi:hypothetical protein
MPAAVSAGHHPDENRPLLTYLPDDGFVVCDSRPVEGRTQLHGWART